MSILIGIATRQKKRAPMQTLDSALISIERGVENDFRGKPSKRQVTVMSKKTWDEVNLVLGTALPWTTRRANLLVDDMQLYNSAGKIICIGDVELLITRETDPCERMQEAQPGLYDVLLPEWRGGVCCRVLREGKVNLGDKIIIREQD